MSDSYRTLAGPGRSEFSVRGSRFLSHTRPVETVDTAQTFIAEIRQEYDDATHNVPAYRVRAAPLREYASDEGEPSGSAGKPALNVLQGQELENTVVVVTRYYGGTDLGIGGLVRAYGRAVKEAVANAGVVDTEPQDYVVVTVDYNDSGTVRSLLESANVEFEADYGERVSFDIRVPVADAATLRDRIRSATSGRAEVDN